MADPNIGVLIQAADAASAVEQIRQAEDAGIGAAWSTMGGAGGGDVMTAFAAALTATDHIVLGTAIVQTWPRHPIVIAGQALALEALGPGRFRLGVGPAHEAAMTGAYGYDFTAPLTNLREYLTVLSSLLHDGEVEFEGRHVTAHSSIRAPVQTPVMASALRPRSFELCGELADGAISWMCPRSYLVEQALPALRRGAEAAGRQPPPLVAHVPICVTEEGRESDELVREQLGNYGRIPFYQAMFAQAGFPDAAERYSDELLGDLVISGSEEQVVAGLLALLESGMGEVLAAPVLDPEDRERGVERAFAAVARAGREASG